MTEIRLGYFTCQQTLDRGSARKLIEELMAESVAAEEAAFDGVFLSEHHQRADNFLPSPVVLAAMLARETERVELGVSVAVLPLYHPLRLAEDATIVDVASGGRLILGLGMGYLDRDFKLFGMGREEARERFEEGLHVLFHAWDSGWSYRGRYYSAEIERIMPGPVSDPHPRLWLAANTREGVRRAARLGAGWVIGARSSLPRARSLAGEYRRACSEAGVAPEVALMRDAWVGATRSEVFKAIGPAFSLPTEHERGRAR